MDLQVLDLHFPVEHSFFEAFQRPQLQYVWDSQTVKARPVQTNKVGACHEERWGEKCSEDRDEG